MDTTPSELRLINKQLEEKESKSGGGERGRQKDRCKCKSKEKGERSMNGEAIVDCRERCWQYEAIWTVSHIFIYSIRVWEERWKDAATVSYIKT